MDFIVSLAKGIQELLGSQPVGPTEELSQSSSTRCCGTHHRPIAIATSTLDAWTLHAEQTNIKIPMVVV